jgi:uncharacterized damage-inducible protein DinB
MIASLVTAYGRYRDLAERALAQVDDTDLHRRVGADDNSLDVLLRHVGGNLRSRFTDFLATDGEKDWRNRDGEFEERQAERAEMLGIWTTGWDTLEAVLASLTDADLTREVVIRGRQLSVEAALLRSYGHTAYHVGQIVQLARTFAGDDWETLSVARGQSEQFTRRMRGGA